jgi:hypothetical protein
MCPGNPTLTRDDKRHSCASFGSAIILARLLEGWELLSDSCDLGTVSMSVAIPGCAGEYVSMSYSRRRFWRQAANLKINVVRL